MQSRNVAVATTSMRRRRSASALEMESAFASAEEKVRAGRGSRVAEETAVAMMSENLGA